MSNALLDTYRTLLPRESGAPAWLAELREAALQRADVLGFPGRRDELWKYTRVGALARDVHAPAGPGEDATLAALVDAHALPEAIACLVFVNGHFRPTLSRRADLPEGARLTSLQDALRSDDTETLRALLQPEGAENALVALNHAFVADGACLTLDADTRVEGVVQLLHVGAGAPDEMSNGLSVLRLGRHAEATVFESFVSADETAPVAQQGTRIEVAEGAHLHHVTLQAIGAQARRFAWQHARVGRDATARFVHVATGGALSRDDLRVEQTGPGAHVDMAAVTVASGTQHIDHSTWLHHALPQGTSDQLYKYILSERAHGVFHGRIRVAQDAQKTAAEQLNQNLLIDEHARISTRPQLEIFADDVTCTHGATIGRLEEEELFYLQSRALGPAQARTLLLRGFVLDVLERVASDDLRTHLRAHVDQILSR